MALEYITDENGMTKEVRIPIEDWNKLTEKYQGIEDEIYELPQWQKDELDKRLKDIEDGKVKFLSMDEFKAKLDAEY